MLGGQAFSHTEPAAWTLLPNISAKTTLIKFKYSINSLFPVNHGYIFRILQYVMWLTAYIVMSTLEMLTM